MRKESKSLYFLFSLVSIYARKETETEIKVNQNKEK